MLPSRSKLEVEVDFHCSNQPYRKMDCQKTVSHSQQTSQLIAQQVYMKKM